MLDDNGDGLISATEVTPVAGVAVNLYMDMLCTAVVSGGSSATNAVTGTAVISGVQPQPAGSYYMKFTAPTGYEMIPSATGCLPVVFDMAAGVTSAIPPVGLKHAGAELTHHSPRHLLALVTTRTHFPDDSDSEFTV